MRIQANLHLYPPWENMILQKAIDVMLTPLEGEVEHDSNASSYSAGTPILNSEATRDTSPDPIIEHMIRAKRKEQPDNDDGDENPARRRRRYSCGSGLCRPWKWQKPGEKKTS